MFNTLANRMMNSIYSSVAFAPEGLGGDDGGDNFESIPGSDEDAEDGDGEPPESQDDDEITGDSAKFMRELFGAGNEDDEDDGEPGESEEEMQAAEKQMAEDLRSGLASLTLSDDIIPEDFDPSDRTQFLKVLNQVQVNTATQAIRLMFAPVQKTMGRLASQMRREMRETSRDGHSRVAEQEADREAFPGIDNPNIAPAIQFALKNARKKHPGDRKAAHSAAKKALNTLGIKGWDVTSSRGSRDESNGGTFRTGKDALDGIGLTLPRRKPADRMRRS